MSSKNYKQSFVLYESVYAQFERLLKAEKAEEANRYIDAVMQYGLYGVVPEESDEVWLFALDNVMASIDSAKSNYRKKIEVPEGELLQYLRQGLTREKIAEKFNCSVDTIRRRIKEYGFENLPSEDYFFDDELANCGTKEGRSYHSHSLSPSDFYSDSLSDSQEGEEINEGKVTKDELIRRKELGF